MHKLLIILLIAGWAGVVLAQAPPMSPSAEPTPSVAAPSATATPAAHHHHHHHHKRMANPVSSPD